MKWVLTAAGVVAGIALVIVLVGWSLPVAHAASRQRSFRAPPEALWKAITDPESFPAWRSDVKRVERLPDREGRLAWVEEGSAGRITFEVVTAEAPRLLVARIADRTLPFGGTWTYEIVPSAAGSTMTITENGEIYNPIFRVMARYVFGYESTMAAYLDSLGRKLEQKSRAEE